jgi:hypothetical protein
MAVSQFLLSRLLHAAIAAQEETGCLPAGSARLAESQTPLDRRSEEELKNSLRRGDFGARRKAFAQEILRGREDGRSHQNERADKKKLKEGRDNHSDHKTQ